MLKRRGVYSTVGQSVFFVFHTQIWYKELVTTGGGCLQSKWLNSPSNASRNVKTLLWGSLIRGGLYLQQWLICLFVFYTDTNTNTTADVGKGGVCNYWPICLACHRIYQYLHRLCSATLIRYTYINYSRSAKKMEIYIVALIWVGTWKGAAARIFFNLSLGKLTKAITVAIYLGI